MWSFAEWLLTERTTHNLLQRDVAEIAQTHPVTLSRWERGQSEPSVSQLRRLVILFGAPPHEALGLDSKGGDLDGEATEDTHDYDDTQAPEGGAGAGGQGGAEQRSRGGGGPGASAAADSGGAGRTGRNPRVSCRADRT